MTFGLRSFVFITEPSPCQLINTTFYRSRLTGSIPTIRLPTAYQLTFRNSKMPYILFLQAVLQTLNIANWFYKQK